jgi:hypothetical protein
MAMWQQQQQSQVKLLHCQGHGFSSVVGRWITGQLPQLLLLQ